MFEYVWYVYFTTEFCQMLDYNQLIRLLMVDNMISFRATSMDYLS